MSRDYHDANRQSEVPFWYESKHWDKFDILDEVRIGPVGVGVGGGGGGGTFCYDKRP
jgi:hypothetical protein